MTIPATVGEEIPLVLILDDGNISMYPLAKIYEAGSATPLVQLNLDHIAEGRYETEWTPTSVGVYSALFFVFNDPARLIESIYYTRELEQIFVTNSSYDDLAAALSRVLGLVHENAFVDNTEFDAANQLLTARVRIFDSKDNAQLATDGGSETTGLIATYTMESAYESIGRMRFYRMVKDS